jgi:hypothetical protein
MVTCGHCPTGRPVKDGPERQEAAAEALAMVLTGFQPPTKIAQLFASHFRSRNLSAV